MARTPDPTWTDPRMVLYQALAAQSQPSRHGLEQLGFDPAVLAVELPRLATLGMVTLLEDGAIVVTDPAEAIPAYAAALEAAAEMSRASLTELTERYTQARAEQERAATFDVTLTRGAAELDIIRQQLWRGARSTLDMVVVRTPANDGLVLSPPPDSPLFDPALRRRMVLDESILEVEGAPEAIARLAASGADVRLRPGLAMGVYIIDRLVGIVDITNHDPSGYGSMVVRLRPLVAALSDLVSSSLAASKPAPRAGSRARERYGEREAQTLALLAAGATDSTIARQLGVSSRTVERFVRKILDDLRATTRFQAGVQAERQRLLDASD